jgi:hypothetical protein
MSNDKAPQNPDPDVLESLFGDVTQLGDEEVAALYDAVAPGEDPGEMIHRLAEKAAITYRLRQQLPPEHVQAALDATRTQTGLQNTKSALKRIVDAIKPPVLGPVGDPSYAFHKREELTEEDRRLLEEQAKELAEDWEEKNEE